MDEEKVFLKRSTSAGMGTSRHAPWQHDMLLRDAREAMTLAE